MILYKLVFLLIAYLIFVIHDYGQIIAEVQKKSDSIQLIRDSMDVAYERDAIKNHEKLDDVNSRKNELYKLSERLITIIDSAKACILDSVKYNPDFDKTMDQWDTVYCHKYSEAFEQWKRVVKETDPSYYRDSLPAFSYSCEFQRLDNGPLVYKLAIMYKEKKGIIQVSNRLTKK